MKQIFLGKPHQSIIDWINGRPPAPPTPSTTPTRIWWSNEESDFSDCPSNNGIFDYSCIPDGKTSTDSVKIEFGTDVNSIANDVFTMGQNLTNIIISNTVRTIGSYTFVSCEHLTTITIPDSIATIGEDAFLCCSGLTSVTITANGGNAEDVQALMIDAGVSESVTWNMPS